MSLRCPYCDADIDDEMYAMIDHMVTEHPEQVEVRRAEARQR